MIYYRVIWNEPGLWYPEHADFHRRDLADECATWLRDTGGIDVTVHELRNSD